MANLFKSFGARLTPAAILRRLPGWLWNRQVKTTREGYLFMGILIAVGAAATNTGNNLLYLVLAMMFAVLFASFLLSEYSIENLHLERELPRRVHAGAEFAVTYRLTNRKRRLASYAVLVEDHPESGSAASRKSGRARSEEPSRTVALFVRVPAGKTETAAVNYREPRRGLSHWDRLTFSTRYPFGFFIKSKTVRLPVQVVVYPALKEVKPELKAPPAWSGRVLTRRRGSGSELWKFRDYLPGDSSRWVHWKTSARVGRLMVREHEEEQERLVSILLHLSRERPALDDPARENAISEAAGLARHFLDRDFLVRVEVHGRGLDFGQGPDHLHRILHFLALFDDPGSPDRGEPLAPAAAGAAIEIHSHSEIASLA